jgi:hypothetical protein
MKPICEVCSSSGITYELAVTCLICGRSCCHSCIDPRTRVCNGCEAVKFNGIPKSPKLPEEQSSTAHAICPYCLYENHVESEDYNPNEREEKCVQCGETFIQQDDFTVTHLTRPITPPP